MEQKTQPIKLIRQRRFLMVLPMLALPFMTLLFWALGGGQGSPSRNVNVDRGFNAQLPGANLKNSDPLDKLSYYEQAESDSLKLRKEMQSDPYYQFQQDSLLAETDTLVAEEQDDTGSVDRFASVGSGYADPNEEKVYRKLSQLNQALNRSTEVSSPEQVDAFSRLADGNSAGNPNVSHLQQMHVTENQAGEPDPEMQQLSGMIDKILDIQHPDRVRERIRQHSEQKRGRVFPVAVSQQPDPVTVLEDRITQPFSDSLPLPDNPVNGFFSLEGGFNQNSSQNAIEAQVHETQTVVNGSTVKLRLTNDIYVNGTLIPANTFLYGVAQLNGERLTIKISSIRYRASLFPVELAVHDMDGLEGIYIPGAIARDVAKESADRSIQDVGFTSLDPSLRAQAASAGIEAAKTLFSKKVKLIKVTVKAGYQVLLHDEKQRQDQ